MSPRSSDPDWLRQLEALAGQEFSVVATRAQAWLDEHPDEPDPVVVRRVQLVLASARTRLGQMDDGVSRMREIGQWAADRGERYLQSRVERLLGVLLRRAGEATASLEHAVASVNLLPADAHPCVLADHLIGLGDALTMSGAVQEGLEQYGRAMQIARDSDDPDLYLLALNNRTYSHVEVGQFREAAEGADELVRTTVGQGMQLPLHILDTAATAYSAVGRLAEAEELFALVDLDADVIPEDLAETVLSLARVRRERGDLDGAQEALDRVAATCAGHELGGVETRALAEQAELAASRGDFQAAFELYKRYHEQTLAHRAVEQEARARMMQAIFEASQARAESQRFREMSYRDPLTRLPNRRYVDEQLSDLLDRHLRSGQPVAVAFIDLDFFKAINDTCSHEVGDEVLRRVAAVLDHAAHELPDAFAARMGGEEFLLALPGCGAAAAVDHLERLRTAVADISWDGLTHSLPVTVSIGCAVAPLDGSERLLLLGAADRRLYAAKDAGRNRVVHPDLEPDATVCGERS